MKETWNKSHKGVPQDKSVSRYAVDRESVFPKCARVLDIGGGIGVDAIYFATKGHTVTLIDISDYALGIAHEKARASGLSMTTKCIDLEVNPLPFLDASFDVVYSRLALHYFSFEKTTEILREIYRVLAPQGVVYITLKSNLDSDEMDFLRQTASQIEPGVFEDQGQTKSRFTSHQLERIVIQAGFKDYKIGTYVEDFAGRIDRVKSKASSMILSEMVLRKHNEGYITY